MAKEETTKAPEEKGPMDYTEKELRKLQLSKSAFDQDVYQNIMKERRAIIRKKKEEEDDRIIISGAELDLIRKRKPKDYDKIVRKLARQRKTELERRLDSTTEYPGDTIASWRVELKAIDNGVR